MHCSSFPRCTSLRRSTCCEVLNSWRCSFELFCPSLCFCICLHFYSCVHGWLVCTLALDVRYYFSKSMCYFHEIWHRVSQCQSSRSFVSSGGGREGRRGASALGGTFQIRGRHFEEDNKYSACVRSFKCFTALNIRPPEVFCDVKNAPIHIRPGLHPIHTLGSSPHSLVGWDLGQDERLPRAPQTLAPPVFVSCTIHPTRRWQNVNMPEVC